MAFKNYTLTLVVDEELDVMLQAWIHDPKTAGNKFRATLGLKSALMEALAFGRLSQADQFKPRLEVKKAVGQMFDDYREREFQRAQARLARQGERENAAQNANNGNAPANGVNAN